MEFIYETRMKKNHRVQVNIFWRRGCEDLHKRFDIKQETKYEVYVLNVKGGQNIQPVEH